MRVRFKRPPIFWVLVAVIGFAVFRTWLAPDEAVMPPQPLDTPDAVTAVGAAVPDATPTAIITPSPTFTSRIVRRAPTPELLQIPDDTTILIPRLGLFATIVETYLDGTSWDVSQLEMNVGHLQGTAWLDENDNVVLSGHVELRDGRAGIFANLENLSVGDRIEITSDNRTYVYAVTEVRSTTPGDLDPLAPTPSDQLTLITCGGYDFFQNAYLERIIVIARPVG